MATLTAVTPAIQTACRSRVGALRPVVNWLCLIALVVLDSDPGPLSPVSDVGDPDHSFRVVSVYSAGLASSVGLRLKATPYDSGIGHRSPTRPDPRAGLVADALVASGGLHVDGERV
jgi:hypothetical protein